jgi:hypothetical protein
MMLMRSMLFLLNHKIRLFFLEKAVVFGKRTLIFPIDESFVHNRFVFLWLNFLLWYVMLVTECVFSKSNLFWRTIFLVFYFNF